MKWTHEVSREWLEARKNYLTASDAINLIPAYKRALRAHTHKDKKTKVITIDPISTWDMIPEFVGLLGEKKSQGIIETNSPSSSAARGHYMEPYAIEQWNDYAKKNMLIPAYHWDDCILHDNKGFAFSPDGLNIKDTYKEVDIAIDSLTKKPKTIFEIKSYNAKKHMTLSCLSEEEQPDKFQIAWALSVCESLEVGILLLYNPALKDNCLYEKIYSRYNLEEEIKLLDNIKEVWNNTKQYMSHNNSSCSQSLYTEQEIYLKYLEEVSDYMKV